MLRRVRTPEGATIRFEYDALGRRILKETHDTCHRYAWDGNVLLHEWSYDRREKTRPTHRFRAFRRHLRFLLTKPP
ncbi:TPA: hypothetical protein ACQ62H_001594 [Neisseria polysaccharea]